jgi:hypothetical protein
MIRMDIRAALLLLLTLCVALGLLTFVNLPSIAESFDGRRAVIVDGDTIAIGSERIRLWNVDAPESFRPRCDAELVAGLRNGLRNSSGESGCRSIDSDKTVTGAPSPGFVPMTGVGETLIAEAPALP